MEANSATEKINQTEHLGKVLNVTEACPKAKDLGRTLGEIKFKQSGINKQKNIFNSKS